MDNVAVVIIVRRLEQNELKAPLWSPRYKQHTGIPPRPRTNRASLTIGGMAAVLNDFSTFAATDLRDSPRGRGRSCGSRPTREELRPPNRLVCPINYIPVCLSCYTSGKNTRGALKSCQS